MERSPERRGGDSPEETVKSILLHIGKILNTRQGSCCLADDFGIPDFTDLATTFRPESIPEIEIALGKIISKYEPRLSEVKVIFDPQPEQYTNVCFKLHGRLQGEQLSLPVIFETLLTADGRLSVREPNR